MRNSSDIGKKLLGGITGKELVGLFLQHAVELGADMQLTFTQEELFKAKSKLTDKQEIEYNAYAYIVCIVEFVAYEARIAALQLIWRLSQCSLSMDYFERLDAAKQTDIHQTMCLFLQRFYTLQAGLRIISKCMGTNLMTLIEHERSSIDAYLACYHMALNALAGDLETDQSHLSFNITALQPGLELAAEIETCLHNPKGKDIWKLKGVLRASAYDFPLK